MSLLKTIAFTPQAMLPEVGESKEALNCFYQELEFALRLGLCVEDLPSGVIQTILSQAQCCGPLGERVIKRIAQSMTNFSHAMSASENEPDCINAASAECSNLALDAFFVRLAAGSPLPCPVFSSRNLDHQPEAISAMMPKRSLTFPMTVDGWGSAVRPLLARTRKACIADPFFNLRNPECFDAFCASLPDRKSSLLYEFDIITSTKAIFTNEDQLLNKAERRQRRDEFSEMQMTALQHAFPSHSHLKVRILIPGARTFHDRHVFTSRLSFTLSNSLQCKRKGNVTLAQLDIEDFGGRRQVVFSDGALEALAILEI